MKQIIKLRESELKKVISESIKKILNEDTIYICWDAGDGNYDIQKYNPKVSWHNDPDVFKGTYDECLKYKEESEIDFFRFTNNMPHKSWGNYTPDM